MLQLLQFKIYTFYYIKLEDSRKKWMGCKIQSSECQHHANHQIFISHLPGKASLLPATTLKADIGKIYLQNKMNVISSAHYWTHCPTTKTIIFPRLNSWIVNVKAFRDVKPAIFCRGQKTQMVDF